MAARTRRSSPDPARLAPRRGPRPDRPLRDHAVAAIWGAAEATAFFLVPDVWLSRLALRSPGRAVRACGSALAGAIAGGLATRAWGRRSDAEAAASSLRRIPAISTAMIERVAADLERDGLRALVAGPTRGIPYKLYAWQAGVRGDGALPLAAWSVPGRLPRFLAVTALALGLLGLARRALPDGWADRLAPGVHAIAWAAFYAWYFQNVGREDRRAPEAAAIRGSDYAGPGMPTDERGPAR